MLFPLLMKYKVSNCRRREVTWRVTLGKWPNWGSQLRSRVSCSQPPIPLTRLLSAVSTHGHIVPSWITCTVEAQQDKPGHRGDNHRHESFLLPPVQPRAGRSVDSTVRRHPASDLTGRLSSPYMLMPCSTLPPTPTLPSVPVHSATQWSYSALSKSPRSSQQTHSFACNCAHFCHKHKHPELFLELQRFDSLIPFSPTPKQIPLLFFSYQLKCCFCSNAPCHRMLVFSNQEGCLWEANG